MTAINRLFSLNIEHKLLAQLEKDGMSLDFVHAFLDKHKRENDVLDIHLR